MRFKTVKESIKSKEAANLGKRRFDRRIRLDGGGCTGAMPARTSTSAETRNDAILVRSIDLAILTTNDMDDHA